MFGTRFSLPFSRIFRLRGRRAAKDNASSAQVARMSCSAPSPLSKSRHPISPQLEPAKTTSTLSTRRPRSLFISSALSPITQSPVATSPDVTLTGTLPTILIIGPDPPQSTHPLLPAPTPSRNVRPRSQVDGVSLLESPPVPDTRRVSFQPPIRDTEDPLASPLSTCSTLVTEFEAQAGAEITSEVPPKRSPTPEALDSDPVGVASAQPIAELPTAVRSGSGRVRPISLFSSQPVRMDVRRFSLPVAPAAPTTTAGTNARDGGRESKRASFMSPASRSGSIKKERKRRMSSWINGPGTLEVLRTLRGTAMTGTYM